MGRIKGFSLIELMVVIAIAAVLSVAAVPAYNKYKIRATVATALPILQDMTDKYIEAITKGGAPGASFNYGGTLIAGNTPTDLNIPPVVRGYQVHFGLSAGGVDSFLVCVFITGLDGVPGYTAPTAGSSGAKNRLCIFTAMENNTFSKYCGIWDSSSTYLPLDYAPASCKYSSLTTCYGNYDTNHSC